MCRGNVLENLVRSAWRRMGGRNSAPLCLMHLRYEPGGVQGQRQDGVMGTHRERTAGRRQQRAACSVSHGGKQDDCHLIANNEYSTCLCVFWRNKRDGGNNCGGRGEGQFTGHHTGVAPLIASLTASPTRTRLPKAKLSTRKNAQTQAGLFQGIFFFFFLLLH